MKNNKVLLSLSLAVLLVFAGASVASATESDWQSLNPGLESGLSGTVHNCSPLTVTNGVVAAYPSCAITCNSGFDLSGATCVVHPSSPIISGGGGGGGSSSTPVVTSCTSVTYSDWGTCVAGSQTRTIVSSAPSGCTLTTAQQNAVQQSCVVVNSLNAPAPSGGSSGLGFFKPKTTPVVPAPKPQVLGVKVVTYPDFSALRDSKTGAIYVIYKDGKYKIKTLKELALYKIKKTINVDTAFLKTFKDLAKYPVAPKKK